MLSCFLPIFSRLHSRIFSYAKIAIKNNQNTDDFHKIVQICKYLRFFEKNAHQFGNGDYNNSGGDNNV